MRSWSYVEPNDPEHDDWSARVITMTEQEIVDSYWPHWSALATKFNAEHTHRQIPITHEACIEDWVVVYWASEAPVKA